MSRPSTTLSTSTTEQRTAAQEAASPSTRAHTIVATTRYDEPVLFAILHETALTYQRRVAANFAAATQSEPTLSRHINPTALEEIRSISRSADSVFGNAIQSLASRLAVARYGDGAPRLYRGAGISPDEPLVKGGRSAKQYIAHRVDRAAVERRIGAVHVKGAPFADVLAVVAELQAAPPLVEKLTYEEVDLLYRADDATLRVFEVKASGHLDSKNGPSNARQVLVKAALAGPGALPCYGVAQREVDGGTAERDLPGHVLGKSAFWQELLPVGLTSDDFDRLFAEAGAIAKAEMTAWLDAIVAAKG